MSVAGNGNRFPFLHAEEQNVKDTVTQACTEQGDESRWEVSGKAGAGAVYR